MRAQAFTNTFSGGMVGDIDAHEQPNNTYRYALGGRIVFNETDDKRNPLDENVKSGSTRAFANIKGNKFALSLCDGYQFIGAAETENGAVIFSTNETYGEIGFLEVNDNVNRTGFAKYTTLFNDRNDPNGDRLNFSVDHYITGSVYVNENQYLERVYFTDAHNQKRVINLKLFYDSQGNPYHPQTSPCSAPATYPKYLSVHAFDERMDLVFPRIKFSRRIVGQLKSGQYQLMMKYVSKTGHSSVWSPDTRTVFVTDQKLDGNIVNNGTTYPNAYKSNHHNRTMGASNIMTEEGIAWSLEGLDTRWDQIKVGYIYHMNDISWEANEFKTYDITSPNLIVNLDTHSGISIPEAEINQRFETQLSVGSTVQQENRIWDADIELLPDTTLDLSGVNIKPTVRYYRPDIKDKPRFDPVFNPVTNRDDNDPITNTNVESGVVTISSFTGQLETHQITDDYRNYKGQQFNYLFKGYFRGETQPFALLLRDRKGNPLFVQHIKDFTFPDQFETKDASGNAVDWTLSKENNDGTYDLRIMGALLSNIRIPSKILFDKFGKLNISSFEIVRTKRIPSIANQGLMFNCNVSPNMATDNEDDGLIHPMEYWDNTYAIKPDGAVPVLTGTYKYYGLLGSTYPRDKDVKFVGGAYTSRSASGIFNYHSPDIIIEQAIGNASVKNEQMIAGKMQKVGFVNKSISEEQVVLFEKHTYRKCYDTTILNTPTEQERIKNGRAKIESTSRIRFAKLHDQSSIFVYEKLDPETSGQLDYRPHVQAFFPGREYAHKATQQPYSVIMRLLDWKLIDSIESSTSRCSYPIVNWKVTPNSYYGDTQDENGEQESESALNTRIYFSTGHFQPITLAILNQAQKTFEPNGQVKEYIFNDVEVWGGDCYVNLWDFTRMYPEYTNCEKYGGIYNDYSDSLICPIESKYNLALIYGRRFAANTVLPQQVSCDGTPIAENMFNGISPRQPENFDYNKVLLLEESVRFYFPKPSNDIKIVDKQETTIRWSPQKIYGELEDSYRQKLVSDYKDVDGSFGKIQKLVPGFDYIYVVQERSFGACLTRADRLITTDVGQLSVTSGSAISGIRYISKVYGSQHRNSIADYDNKIIFTDGHMGKIVLFSQSGLNPESETDLMNDPIAAKTIYMDQPIKHKNGFVDIIAGVDRENGDFLTTFLYDNGITDNMPGNLDKSDEMKSFTICLNVKINKWHFYHPFTPYNYFNIKRYLFSTNPLSGSRNQVFLSNHGKYGNWCGIYHPTILEFIVNPSASVAKVFDNAYINVNEDSFMRIAKVTCTVNKNVHTLKLASVINNQIVPNFNLADFMEDSLRFPLFEQDDVFDEEKERLRGHYMKVRIEIDNSQSQWDNVEKSVVISTFDTRFRVSSPMQFQ